MAESVNKKIVAALSSFGLPVAEELYHGKQKSYFVYYITDDAMEDAGDDTVQAYVTYVHVHYVCPMGTSYVDMKRRIRKALVDAGFTPPSVTDLSDLTNKDDESELVRRLVFETSIENEYDMEV